MIATVVTLTTAVVNYGAFAASAYSVGTAVTATVNYAIGYGIFLLGL